MTRTDLNKILFSLSIIEDRLNSQNLTPKFRLPELRKILQIILGIIGIEICIILADYII